MSKLKYYDGSTWKQAAPSKEEFDTEVNRIDILSQDISNVEGQVGQVQNNLTSHLAEKASEEQLGHIKVGANLSIEEDGTLNAQGGVHYNITNVDPTSDDGVTKGYKVGSRWINEANEMEYICVSNAENKAVWRGTTEDRRIFDVTIVGLEWNQGTDSYQRLDNAEGLTVGASVGGQPIQSDFDNIYPWSDMRRCNLADNGTVNAYHGDPLYAENGSNGQVMVEIPKFWYKSEKVGSVYRWWIADKPTDGFKVHPAFISNGIEKDKFYFSAYEGNVASGVMRSISGVQPSTSTNVSGTIANFRSYAQARGTGWQQQLFLPTTAIQLLYLIEFAHFDTQSKIGRGVVDLASGTGNHSINTGQTANLGNKSGRASGTNGQVSISYRGIENFWGNIWKWIDGYNINNRIGYVADHGFVSDKFTDNYKQVGFTNATANGYVSNIGWTTNDDYMFIATQVSGSETTYLHDHYWQNTGARVAIFGGAWGGAGLAGGFCWDLLYASSDSARNVGGRALFIP